MPQDHGGHFNLGELCLARHWDEERARGALGAAARRGLVWVDDPPGGAPREYWVPALGMEASIARYKAQRA
jgi:hypothetical protein